jgi:formylglycine-generating enzyme required for sulfatase activity/predicted GH43/DUF377 family glycosyl hydrolase
MKGLSKLFPMIISVLILVSCSTPQTTTQAPPPLIEETPTPIPATEVPTPLPSPTDIPVIFEPPPEEVVFSYHDPDRKSILPGKVGEMFPGVNTEAGAIVRYGGMFHILYNVLYDYPPTTADIGYARSVDGIKWEQVSEESVFSAKEVPYADNVVLASDMIVEDDGTFVLYFHTTSSEPYKVGSSIGRATAASPQGPWQADSEPALIPSESGWDAFEVKYPCVLKVDGKYFMYYQGTHRANGKIAFGLATSEDGIDWTRREDPIFTANQVPWEEFASIRYPAVVHTPTGFLMLFRVQGAVYSEAYTLAVSPDGIHWKPGLDSPVIDLDQYPGFSMAFSPEFEYVDGQYFAYIQTISRTSPGKVNLFTFDHPLVAGENISEMPAISLVDDLGVPMIQIPAGEFIMGSERGDEDVPPHPVYLDSYAIDQYEVTNQLFVKFLNQNGNQVEENTKWLQTAINSEIDHRDGVWEVEPGYEKYPVRAVSWFGAEAFCEWRGGRLPTEAEWEKAARGSESVSPFPWGKGIDCEIANYSVCNIDAPYRTGSIPENVSPYGVYDMAGNVAEFTHDWYAPDYYLNSPYKNPTGPESSPLNTVASRGGSFFSQMKFLKVYHRVNEFHRSNAFRNVGFRCVIPPVGSRENPVQVGEAGYVEDFRLTIRTSIRPADEFVQDRPAENHLPENGMEYVVIELNAICDTKTIIDCHIRLENLKLTGTSETIRQPDRINGFPSQFRSTHMPRGVAFFRHLVFQVEKGEEGLVLYYESDTGESVFLAVE